MAAAPYYFSVSLRARHPAMDLEVLTPLLGLKPSNFWKAGERRRTPKGVLLKGLNRHSFWTARLVTKRYATSPGKSLEASLAFLVRKFESRRALFRRIQRTGGQTELFIGLFGEKSNFGSELQADLLTKLGKMGLSLSLDIYS